MSNQLAEQKLTSEIARTMELPNPLLHLRSYLGELADHKIGLAPKHEASARFNPTTFSMLLTRGQLVRRAERVEAARASVEQRLDEMRRAE